MSVLIENFGALLCAVENGDSTTGTRMALKAEIKRQLEYMNSVESSWSDPNICHWSHICYRLNNIPDSDEELYSRIDFYRAQLQNITANFNEITAFSTHSIPYVMLQNVALSIGPLSATVSRLIEDVRTLKVALDVKINAPTIDAFRELKQLEDADVVKVSNESLKVQTPAPVKSVPKLADETAVVAPVVVKPTKQSQPKKNVWSAKTVVDKPVVDKPDVVQKKPNINELITDIAYANTESINPIRIDELGFIAANLRKTTFTGPTESLNVREICGKL